MVYPDRLQQKMSWVYLINLIFYLIPLFTVRFAIWQYLSMAAALLLFVLCYFWAHRSNKRDMHWPIIAMTLIAVLITPVNPGSISMFAYVGFFIGFAYTTKPYLLLLTALSALLLLLNWQLDIKWPYFVSMGIPMVIAVSFFGRIELARLRQQLAEQQSADEIKQLAAMVERERIARDLHDILGHTLSSIALKADLAQKLLSRDKAQEATVQLNELSQIARDALSQVRQSVSGFKHQGLTAEVGKLLARLRDAGFAAELIGEIPSLTTRQESAIILALTELVTNVIRHSRGTHCTLQFTKQADSWQICLSDDGSIDALREGNGLSGLRERLAALGGNLAIAYQQGVQACISVPVKEVSI